MDRQVSACSDIIFILFVILLCGEMLYECVGVGVTGVRELFCFHYDLFFFIFSEFPIYCLFSRWDIIYINNKSIRVCNHMRVYIYILFIFIFIFLCLL